MWTGLILCSTFGAALCDNVGETKTEYSNRPLAIDGAMLEALKTWKQGSEFSGLDDWMFAYKKAAKAAGVGTVSTHNETHVP
jgi:hypothetical protein